MSSRLIRCFSSSCLTHQFAADPTPRVEARVLKRMGPCSRVPRRWPVQQEDAEGGCAGIRRRSGEEWFRVSVGSISRSFLCIARNQPETTLTPGGRQRADGPLFSGTPVSCSPASHPPQDRRRRWDPHSGVSSQLGRTHPLMGRWYLLRGDTLGSATPRGDGGRGCAPPGGARSGGPHEPRGRGRPLHDRVRARAWR